jgi:hypothetical protein
MLGDGDTAVKAEPHQTGIQDHWLSLRSKALQVLSNLILPNFLKDEQLGKDPADF